GGSGTQAENAAELGMRQREQALAAAARDVADAEADHETLLRRSEWARLALRDDTEALASARATVGTSERRANEARAALAKVEQRIALTEANRAAAQRRTAEVVNLARTANQRLEELARAEQEAREARLAALTQELRHQRDNAEALDKQITSGRDEMTRAAVERIELERELA